MEEQFHHLKKDYLFSAHMDANSYELFFFAKSCHPIVVDDKVCNSIREVFPIKRFLRDPFLDISCSYSRHQFAKMVFAQRPWIIGGEGSSLSDTASNSSDNLETKAFREFLFTKNALFRQTKGLKF